MGQKADYRSVTALVIDDNENMVKITSALLLAFGFGRILKATSAMEGYKIFQDTTVDLVIVDYHMPIMDGLAYIHKVRTDLESPNHFVPVIMLTAHAELAFICQARDCGVTEFMRKPLSPKDLYRKIDTIIEHPRPFVKIDSFFGPDRRRRANPNYTGQERRDISQPAQHRQIGA